MGASNIFDSSQSREVQRSIRKRRNFKKEVDKVQKFSAVSQNKVLHATVAEFSEEDKWTRLIEEGVLVDEDQAGNSVASYVIGTGVIKRMYNQMPDDFEGYIDKDHIRAIYLGTFTKNDLRLVPIENNRYALDVRVNLDHQLNAVADLLREDQYRAISVDLGINDADVVMASELGEEAMDGGYDYPVIHITDASLHGYAVVRNPKDPNAYNDFLLNFETNKGVDMTTNDEKATEALQAAEEEKVEVTQAEEENNVEEKTLEATTETIEEEDTENEGEEVSKEVEKDNDDELPEEVNASTSKLEELGEAINQLKAQITEKDARIAALEKKLSAESIAHMSVEEQIGRLIASATVAQKSEAEGSKTTTPEANNIESRAESISAAFASL